MRTMAFLACMTVTGLTIWGQSAPPGTISSPAEPAAGTNVNPATANLIGGAHVTFTNNAGATYSVAQLSSQLQALRSAVDRLQPTLAAFNVTFSNSVSGGAQSLGGAISDFLKGLNRDSSQDAGNATGGASTNRFLAALDSLLGGNPSSAPAANPNTVKDLLALEKDLRSVASILQDLRVTGAGEVPGTAPAFPTGPLTPTGR